MIFLSPVSSIVMLIRNNIANYSSSQLSIRANLKIFWQGKRQNLHSAFSVCGVVHVFAIASP